MGTVIIALLVLGVIVSSTTRILRWMTGERALNVVGLESRYWYAREIGDVAGADQIEAQLRDTPGSGWGRPAGKTQGM